MSKIKTYMLAPSIPLRADSGSSCHPWLGNIIADPHDPVTTLLDKLPTPPNDIEVASEDQRSVVRSQKRSLLGSVWANFWEVVTVKIHLSGSRGSKATYKMDKLETRSFIPNEAEVARRVTNSSRIQKAINSGMMGKAPVYIITGIKVATGFSMDISSDTDKDGKTRGSGPADPTGGLSIGLEINFTHHKDSKDASKVPHDILFAYQLWKIREVKGAADSTEVRLHQHRPRTKDGFLGKEQQEEPEHIVATEAAMEDLRSEEYGEDIHYTKVDAGEDHEEYIFVVPFDRK